MLIPMRFNSASVAGSVNEIPAARVGGISTEGASDARDGPCLRDMASAMVAATKPLTDAPAVTAAVSIASRCSIDTRREITVVFGFLLLTGGPRLSVVSSVPARMGGR